jgi:hypothetical protein
VAPSRRFPRYGKKEWLSVPNGTSPMENWQNKIRHLRSYLRGWAKNMSSIYKSEKVRLSSIIDMLDLKAKTILLLEDERRCLKNANDELAKLRRDEETKWAHVGHERLSPKCGSMGWLRWLI